MVHGLAMDDFIRVTRVLTYEGPRGEVEEQLSKSMGDGVQRRGARNVLITATTIGNFPQVITSGTALEEAREEGRRQGLQEAQSIPRYRPFPSLSREKLDPGVGWNPEHPLEGVASVAKRLEETRLKEAWNKEEGK